MFRSLLVIAIAAVAAALASSGAEGSRATAIRCGPFNGAPWSATVGGSVAPTIHGNTYYAIYTADLPGCAWVERHVRQLLRLKIDVLRHFSFVGAGQRLACQPLKPPSLGLRSVTPRSSLGYCGTDGARVARLGVWAAAGTEIAWFIGDKPRG
jgi:hypothetical protein